MSARTRLAWIERNVRDIGLSVAFYREALGFSVIEEAHSDPAMAAAIGFDGQVNAARLRIGAQEIVLTSFDPAGAAYPLGSTSDDLSFQHIAVVTQDIESAYRRAVKTGGVPISKAGPERLPPSSGGVEAWKFRDPDGHPLELIALPRGEGNATWQNAVSGAGINLGFDHTAIAVSDAERSIDFYTETFGFQVISRQVNHGIEQDRLDGLDQVSVEVVGLALPAAATPHLELLCYRAPGRREIGAMRIADIARDRIVIAGDTLRAALFRDPDGHVIRAA